MKTYLLNVFLVISCITYAQKPQTFKITEALELKKELKLSQLAKKVEYIQLETTSASILSEITKVIIEDNIYIKTKDGLFVFALDGKFLRKIGNRGKGPKEYLSMIDFDVNKEAIYTLDVLSHKIFEFQKDGNFTKYIGYKCIPDKIVLSNQQIYLANSTDPTFWGDIDSGILLSGLDKMGQSLPPVKNSNREMPSAVTNIYNYKGNIHYRQTLNDTVFCLSNNQLSPRYLIDLGKYKPIKTMYKKNEVIKTQTCSRIEESDQFVFLWIKKVDNTTANVVYDKTSPTLFAVKDGEFKNDIDNGISFWPEHVTNNKLVKTLWYPTISEIVKEKKAGAALQKKYEKMDVNSNPILMILSK